MTHWYYMITLIFSCAGMLIIDWRYKLAFWNDARRTTLTLGCAILLFIVWDNLGLALGIFFKGHSPYTPVLMLWPDFPLEEILFLFLLCHVTLSLHQGGARGFRHIRRS